MRRIFVAVNLPEQLKKRLEELRENFFARSGFVKDEPRLGGNGVFRWTKGESLHLTLVFIGYASDEQTLEVCRVCRRIASEFEPFLITFRHVIFGPPGKPPRMVWLEGEASEELANLKNKVEDALIETDSGLRRKEARIMRPHITLARIKMGEWRQMDGASDIEQNFQAQVPVNSIEIMESDLKRDGAEYTILESAPLGS